ncbi:hypothetical protein F511_37136 [Dorcoceras hygrometricum]|uniref:Uncharacterized protein n=1 Tax=Dorcoceras hygrometricum TaxID=472368 RepID=A0A2Z7A7U9_9LAMI|nr:hypothetical protein F511_37136 [Dorcoceras hygrometricum]
MPCVSPDFHQESFRIKHDDLKLFEKLLSKDSTKSNPSFRVLYYGDVSGAVPFVWETCPGTPKHTAFPHNLSIPPLTPPPSYYTSSSNNGSMNRSSGSKLMLHTLLRRMSFNYKKNSHLPSSPKSSSSDSWLSDSAGITSTAADLHKRKQFLSCFF